MPLPDAPLLSTISPGGWVQLVLPDSGVTVWVRFLPSERGALERTDLYVVATDAPDSDVDPASPAVLRKVGAVLERLLIWANSPEVRDQILDLLHDPGTGDLAGVDVRSQLEGQDPGRDEPGPRRQRRRIAERAQLVVPETRPYPDEFYQQVASLYTDLAWRSNSPAKDIADEYDVPVRTVHGWVAAARERGFLAQTTQGRVG